MKLTSALAGLAIVIFSSISSASGDHAGGHSPADAIGIAGKPESVTRTIAIDMWDSMRFTPATIKVRQNETIKFIIRNRGKIAHEMVLGTEKELKEHYEVMKKHPEMEHADENMVTVQPGKTGEIVWQFTTAGTVDFACLLPGHYEAGMKGTVKVDAKSGKRGSGAQHKH